MTSKIRAVRACEQDFTGPAEIKIGVYHRGIFEHFDVTPYATFNVAECEWDKKNGRVMLSRNEAVIQNLINTSIEKRIEYFEWIVALLDRAGNWTMEDLKEAVKKGVGV